ncbi:MAG: ribonuclease P protein component [Planctomycetota bacterium]|jgi:ribonuclease P protein component
MGRFSFPRQARLLRERDFLKVYRAGRRLRAFPLRACALRRADGESRLGLSIGRKVGPAVVRNRWKRAIREAFRLHRRRLRAPYDMAVSVSRDATPADARRVEESFNALIDQLNAEEGEGSA